LDECEELAVVRDERVGDLCRWPGRRLVGTFIGHVRSSLRRRLGECTGCPYTACVHKLHVVLVALGLAACIRDAAPPPAGEHAAVVLPTGYDRVADPSLVCMVNDQFMGTPQIPIAVAGRTYYG